MKRDKLQKQQQDQLKKFSDKLMSKEKTKEDK